jgi:hypothetical protein
MVKVRWILRMFKNTLKNDRTCVNAQFLIVKLEN